MRTSKQKGNCNAKRRNGGFYAPVSASKISVPDSDVRDRFDDWVGGWQFGPFRLHHPVLPNRRSPGRLQRGRFCGDFRRYHSALSVSGDTCGLSSRFLASRLCIQNSVPRSRVSMANTVRRSGNIVSLGRQKSRFEPGAIIAGSIRAPRTVERSAVIPWMKTTTGSMSYRHKIM